MKNKIFPFAPFIFFIVIILIIIFSNNRCNDDNSNLSPKLENAEHSSGNKLQKKIKELNNENLRNDFKEFIRTNKGVAMILFYKDNCRFCVEFKSNFEIIANEYKNHCSYMRHTRKGLHVLNAVVPLIKPVI